MVCKELHSNSASSSFAAPFHVATHDICKTSETKFKYLVCCLTFQVHQHVHKNKPLDPILNQLNPIQSHSLFLQDLFQYYTASIYIYI
jgi:hypothetical protein